MAAPPPPPSAAVTKKTYNKQAPAKSGDAVLFLAMHVQPYHSWISKDVVKVLFTTAATAAQLDPSAKRAYDKIEIFDNYNTTGLVELRALQLHADYEFKHVVCLGEEDIIRSARIRELLNITTNQWVESALLFRDKIIMKKCLERAGLAVPTYKQLESATDLIAFIDEHGYPAVVKPARGYGSVNTWILRTEEDLVSLLKQGLAPEGMMDCPIDLEVEKFIDGKFYHIDGLVYNGEIRVIWPSEYLLPPGGFSDNPLVGAFALAPTNPLTLRIQEFTKACLEALSEGVPDCYPFHAEVWHTPDDQLVFCEVASRTGGGGIPFQFLELFGFNLNKTHAQAQCNDTITASRLGPLWHERVPICDYLVGWLFVYPQQGRLAAVPTACTLECVLSYEAFHPQGAVFTSRASCTDAVCALIVKGTTEEEVRANVMKSFEWFQSEAKYEVAVSTRKATEARSYLTP